MDKKGGGHVDWIISIGIFLIYLLSMFVLIKPGVIPSHNPDTLLDILEENAREDFYIKNLFDGNPDNDEFGGFYWTLNKLPLFVKSGSESGTKCIKINFPYEDISQDKLNVYEINDIGEITSKNRQLSGSNLYIEEVSLNSDFKKYLIYFSNSEGYTKNNYEQYISGDIQFSNEIIDTSLCLDSPDQFEYKLGVNEKTRGIAEPLLSFFNSGGEELYKLIKKKYGYPSLKEYSASVIDSEKEYGFKPVEPPVDANIYTRQWGDFILQYDGTRRPVKVVISVW